MKPVAVFIVLFALIAAGCTETALPVSGSSNGIEMTSKSPQPVSLVFEKPEVGSDAFIRHMHFHASQLKWLNEALAAGDLNAARTPAYWLAGHRPVTNIPEEWRPFVMHMRDAARAANEAPDLPAARAAAQQIAVGCKGCHAEAGVYVPSLESD